MPAIPALLSPYSGHGDVPFTGANTTTTLLDQFFFWCLSAGLLNNLAGLGIDGGAARTAANTLACIGSSDGVTAALDGNNRLGSTFNASKIVRAANGVAHSWIVVGDANYQYCFDKNSTAVGTSGAIRTPTSAPFTGGSTTSRPTSTAEVVLGSTATPGPTSTVSLFSDQTLNQNTFFHFGINADGTRWWYAKSRQNQGCFDGFGASWLGVGHDPLDTRNDWWLFGGATATGRGAGNIGSLTVASGATRRGWANANPPSTGGIRVPTYGSTSAAGTGADVARTKFTTLPLEMGLLVPGAPLDCGYLPDIFFTFGGDVGAQIPAPPALPERAIIGDVGVPCPVKLTK